MRSPFDPRRLLAAVLAGLIAAAVVPAGNAALAAGKPPSCTVGDTLTRYRVPSDWYRSLLDTELRLRSSYAPKDLVNIGRSGVDGGGRIRKIALADFTAMYKAARRAGARFAVESAYRSYATQGAVFRRWVSVAGYDQAILASARPGHSEHQLGTAVDLKTPGGPEPWRVADWGTTKPGAWLAKHSWKYGWVLSYPKDRSPKHTCYKYEPWHFRYIGKTLAAEVHESGRSLREWLWRKGANDEWTGGPPNPKPTPSPTPTPEPTAEPTDPAPTDPAPTDPPPTEPPTPAP